jgi:antibiotic biosynthesis monooxygenase (ABM) superfamily enzyme
MYTMTPTLPRLTGPYTTAELEAITEDPVTVAVAWVSTRGNEEAFLAELEALAHAAQHASGALGMALLEPGEEGGEYHVVVRFKNAGALRAWEDSATRREIVGRLTPYVADAKVATTHSPEAFFAGLMGTTSRPVHHQFLVDLLWVLPVAFVVSFFVSPYTNALPVWVRILIGSVVGSLLYTFTLGRIRRVAERFSKRRAPLR